MKATISATSDQAFAETGGWRTRPLWSALLRLRRNKVALACAAFLALMTVAAIAAPVIVPDDPLAMQPTIRFQGPTLAHPFGTDEFGRDILSRTIYGARISLEVGIISVGISLVAGTILGVIAAYYGRFIDTVISRLMDILFAFPAILLAIAMMAVLGANIRNVMLAIGLVNTPIFMRVSRAAALSVRASLYVEAAESVGASDWHIMSKHVFPNITAPLIVQSTLAFAWAIIAEAALSFLGLGTQPPTPSWGIMLSTGRQFMDQSKSEVVFVGAAIVLAVLSLNILGDGLRDVLDPRMKID
ncbi:MAG TPA: ABC transporter permease [Chloroflexota bacterium]|nr:ABC transporter permease [Chloroflexota bacterium]